MIARAILGALFGGVVGYAVYRLVGCSSGACPITSSPWVSTLYGIVMGALFSGAFH